MKLTVTYIHWGFYRILCDSGLSSTDDWKRYGAWWLGTISSIHYLLGLYIVGAGLVDRYLFPHDFPNKLVPLVLLAILLYFAGVASDHAWFGSDVRNLAHWNAPEKTAQAKKAAIGFLVVGLVLFYASLLTILP